MMEKQLECVLLLSLSEMALRRVAVLLWSSADDLDSIWKIPNSWFLTDNKNKWREITEKVEDRMSKLELPESLKKPMIDIVIPMSLDVKRWKDIYRDLLEEIILPGSIKLCWTTAGKIDFRKMAEELVRCDVLSVEHRYQIACEYCLEDSVPFFWEELDQENKEGLYNEYPISSDLEVFWPRILKGELYDIDYCDRDRDRFSLNLAAFEHSAKKGLKTATAYFFQKLTHEEKEASLMRTAREVLAADFDFFNFREGTLSGVSCYLLSIMTPDQQMEIVKEQPVEVLLSFLVWPQDLFLKNADLIWTFISPYSYLSLLSKIEDILEMSDHCFPKLFQVFFIHSPRDFKKYFVEQESCLIQFMSTFFRDGDSETIGVIFRNVDAEDRVSLVFHPRMFSIFLSSMVEDKWHPVEVCLREVALSKEDRQRLKENFMEFLKRRNLNRVLIGWRNREFKRFSEILDRTDAGADNEKRGMKRRRENCSP